MRSDPCRAAGRHACANCSTVAAVARWVSGWRCSGLRLAASSRSAWPPAGAGDGLPAPAILRWASLCCEVASLGCCDILPVAPDASASRSEAMSTVSSWLETTVLSAAEASGWPPQPAGWPAGGTLGGGRPLCHSGKLALRSSTGSSALRRRLHHHAIGALVITAPYLRGAKQLRPHLHGHLPELH